MDTLVPSYLSTGGVIVPLYATAVGVGPAKSVAELESLRYAIENMVNGDSRDVPVEVLARTGFREQALWAEPIQPDDPIDSMIDGLISWRYLSGRWPDLADAFMTCASFVRHQLVVPRPAMVDLIVRLRGLRDDVLSGRRVPRVDETPVPPQHPLSPEMVEYDRQRAFSRDDGWAYAKELYARRG